MSTPRFTFTSRARPIVQLGVGSGEYLDALWDQAHWDVDVWGGAEPSWRDVTCDSFSFRCEYGRQRSTDRFVVGQASLVVWNATGWADPNTVDEPGTLTMRPGRPIRVGIAHATLGTRWLFRGYIDAMTPVYDPTETDTVELSCIDALGEVNRAKLQPLDVPLYAGDPVNVRIGRLLDAVSWPTGKRKLSPTGDTLIAHDLGGQLADLLGQAADSGGGNVYGDLDGDVVYRSRDWQTFVPGTPVDATIGNVEPGHVIPGTPQIDGYLNGTGNVITPDSPDLSLTGDVRLTARVRRIAAAPPAAVQFRQIMYQTGTLNGYQWFERRDPNPTTSPSFLRVDVKMAGTTAGRTYWSAAQTDQAAPVGSDAYVGVEIVTRPTPRWVGLTSADGVLWSQLGAGATENLGFIPNDPDYSLAVGGTGSSSYWDGRIYWAQAEAINRSRLVFPGIGGNYLSVAAASVPTTADDFEIVMRLAPDSWFSAAVQRPFGRYGPGANAASWQVQMASGYLGMILVPAGGTNVTVQATASFPFTATATGWIKVTRRASDGRVQMFTAADAPTEPTSWTQLGTDRTGPIGALNAAATTNVLLGAYWDGMNQPYAGRLLRAILRSSIGGATVLDITENDPGASGPGSSSTFTARSGQTVTVSDSSGGAFLAGAVGNVSTPDPGVLPASFVIVYRARNVVNSGFPVFAAQNSGSDPRSYVAYPTLTNTRINFESSADGIWANRQIRFADRPIPPLGVDRTEAIAVTPNAAGRHLMTAWTYDDATQTWTQRTTRDTGAALTPFDVTTLLILGGGFQLGERLYWSEMRTGTDPRAGTVLWRFDANERTGTGTTYTDPRGRTWTLSASTVIAAKSPAPIVQGQPNRVIWRFDANDYPGTGTSYTDPRGRTWTLLNAGVITPKVPGVPDVVVPADVCPVQWERPFARSDLATRVIIGRDAQTAIQLDDPDGQVLYGIEPFERIDLLTERDDKIMLLGTRILRVRSAHAAPRIRSVTLDAATTDDALDLMSTVDVYKPSRYRCRLQYPEPRGLVFDLEHLATGVAHELTPERWQLALNLDLAAPYAAAGGRWDGAYWDQATWATPV